MPPGDRPRRLSRRWLLPSATRPAAAATCAVGALVTALVLRPDAPGDSPQWDPVAKFLIATAMIVLVSQLVGGLLRLAHQPLVVGEILGGLLLGPSALGAMAPSMSQWLFDDATTAAINMTAQLGLVTFMFLLGCETREHGGHDGPRAVAVVTGSSMALPFFGGFCIGFVTTDLADDSADRLSYALFLGLALAITALPVLARTLTDLRLTDTHVGSLALRSAATGDAVAWGVLAVLLSSVDGRGLTDLGLRFVMAAAFVAVAVFCVRPAVSVLSVRLAGRSGESVLVAVVLAGAMGSAAIAQAVGLHPAVGAFVFGAAMPRANRRLASLTHRLQSFAVTVLLPLFFASVGLQASIGLLGTSARAWGILLLVLSAAFLTKLLGGYLGARAAHLPARQALQVGTLMNCRGVTELVVASVGYQHGLINAAGLAVLVLVALVTTAMTGPLLRVLGVRTARSRSDAQVVQHCEDATVV